jgi:hypothetical protein
MEDRMTFNIVLLVLVGVLLIAQGLLLRKISKFRRLSQAGFDHCIKAVELHTRGEDWRPVMEEAKSIREELTQL